MTTFTIEPQNEPCKEDLSRKIKEPRHTWKSRGRFLRRGC
jgi:hypothetical protein